jgi:hypothetical protein
VVDHPVTTPLVEVRPAAVRLVVLQVVEVLPVVRPAVQRVVRASPGWRFPVLAVRLWAAAVVAMAPVRVATLPEKGIVAVG